MGSHFIINNLFQAAFVLLWVHSRFWIAELFLVLNFLNLVALYLRYPTTPRFIHIPVVSGPLAWTFVAIFWDGAAMVGAHHTAARILANVVVWSILVFGFLFLVAFKDYTISFELSALSAGEYPIYSPYDHIEHWLKLWKIQLSQFTSLVSKSLHFNGSLPSLLCLSCSWQRLPSRSPNYSPSRKAAGPKPMRIMKGNRSLMTISRASTT